MQRAALILAVLVDAINVFAWLRSDARREQTPYFHRSGEVGAHEGKSLPVLVRSVCDALNIQAETLRERIGLAHGSTDLEWPRHLRSTWLGRAQHMTADRVHEKRSAPSRNGGLSTRHSKRVAG